jgi:ABC-type Mn2+/Zn2+ transport system permease subunit
MRLDVSLCFVSVGHNIVVSSFRPSHSHSGGVLYTALAVVCMISCIVVVDLDVSGFLLGVSSDISPSVIAAAL